MELFISSTAVNSRDICECVSTLAKIGVKNIELSGGTEYDFFDSDKLLTIKDEYSLNYLIHNYFPPHPEPFVLNLASQDVTSRIRSIDFCKTSIDLANKLSVDRYIAHAGYVEEMYVPVGDDELFVANGENALDLDLSINCMNQSVNSVCSYGMKKNIRFGLENLFPFGENKKCSLLSTPKSIFNYLESSEDIEGGFLLDLGHLLISANYFGFDKDLFVDELVDQYSNRILEVHISGNDGIRDLHSSLSTQDWQVMVLDKLKFLNVPITIEVRAIDNTKILEQIGIISSFL